MSRVDSLTDLTSINFEEIDFKNQEQLLEHYEDLRQRFDKAITEIRSIKKELRESYKSFDSLELKNFTLNQDLSNLDNSYKSQISLMADRIQDLTMKLSSAEKQNRIIKSKVHHTKDKYRSLSLITNTESFLVQKEIEDKITNLEKKINCFEQKQLRLQDTKSTSPMTRDPLKMIIRLNSLDQKLSNLLSNQNDDNNNRNYNQFDDLLKAILKDGDNETFKENLLKFRNCTETKVVEKTTESLSKIDLLVRLLTFEKINFDYLLIELNSLLNQNDQSYKLFDRLQFCYDHLLSEFKDCVPHVQYPLLLMTTFVPQNLLNLFEKIVLDVRLFEKMFNSSFLKPNVLYNSR